MNILLTMNLTGTVLLIWYYLLKHAGKEGLSRNYLYLLLRINVLCFLVPLILLGEIYRGILKDFLLLTGHSLDQTGVVSMNGTLLVSNENSFWLSRGLQNQALLFTVHAVILVLGLGYCWLRDRKKNSMVRAAAQAGGVKPHLTECLQRMKEQYHVRRNVAICLCRDVSQIATIGNLHPVIFFREPEDPRETEFLLGHELYHIRRWDVLWIWLARFLKYLFFWNPATHLLCREIDRLREQSCDEKVIENLDVEETGRYAGLLVKYSTVVEDKTDMATRIFYSGNNSAKELKERLEVIMSKKNKRWNKSLVGMLLAVVLMTTSLTAFAYDEIMWYEGAPVLENTAEDGYQYSGQLESIMILPAGSNTSFYDDLESIPILYDKEYVDGDENIWPLTESDIQPMAICIFHSYTSVTLVEHYVSNDGGCAVQYYSADRCQKCGKIQNKTLLHTLYYTVCPH